MILFFFVVFICLPADTYCPDGCDCFTKSMSERGECSKLPKEKDASQLVHVKLSYCPDSSFVYPEVPEVENAFLFLSYFLLIYS